MRLILVRSCPGGGKSTFVRAMFPDLFHVENDMWHVRDWKYAFNAKKQDAAVGWCMDMCERALAEGMDVVVSNTFTKLRYIEVYRRLAVKYSAEFTVYRMRGEFENKHGVPAAVLENMRRNFADWTNEINVYPNLSQDKSDPCYRPYMLTRLKIGDKIATKRFADKKDTHTITIGADGVAVEGDSFEMEDCIATITDIRQGTYDYLNISYVEDDTGKPGVCMSGDCRKIG